MDENDVHTMLGRLADTEAPPPRIDIRQAINRGRRRRRLRVVKAAGSTLSLGAVVGVAVALAVPGGAPTGSTPGPGPSASASPALAPARFNPVVPFASFGWLPAGYTPGGGNAPGSADIGTQIEDLSAGSDSPKALTVDLLVTAARACTDSGSEPVLKCPLGIGSSFSMRATSSAPDVNGRPAYWAKRSYSSALLWQYAPGAWSILAVPTNQWPLTPAGARMLIRIAANVRYGNTTPLKFPFWTADLPPGWALSLTTFRVSPSGELSSLRLDLGPATAPQAVYLDVSPVTPGSACGPLAPPGFHLTHVTLDGTKATLMTGHGRSDLCASDVDGLAVGVDFSATDPSTGRPVPGLSLPGGVLGLAKSLHLLGPDRSNWTSSPVR
jgi:hypothetical protein